MLNYIFQVYTYDDALPDKPGADSCRIIPSLLLEPDATQQTTEQYRRCSETNAPEFALSISVHAPLSPLFLQQLLSFFFIPSCFQAGNQRVLALLGANTALLAHAEKLIREQASLQGIVNLVVHCPVPYEKNSASAPVAQNEAGYLFSDSTTFTQYYAALMTSNQPYNHAFYLQRSAVPDRNELVSKLTAAEEKLKTNQPALYELANSVRRLSTENEALRQKLLAAENEVNNYQSHLEIMRSGHQAKELQAYYTNEYEILPRWYKRVGQLVKVMMGKRSAGSLFNDHVKKYKH